MGCKHMRLAPYFLPVATHLGYCVLLLVMALDPLLRRQFYATRVSSAGLLNRSPGE
jgi:hypothetical protein